MAPRLKPIKSAEELSAIPLDEPVLVELEPAKTGVASDDAPVEHEDNNPPEQGFKALKQELEKAQAATKAANETAERERTRAREAERERLRAAQEAEEARSRVSSTEASMVEAGKEAAERERENARKAIKQAFEAGDSDALADAQERLAQATADIREYDRAASDLEARKTKPVERQQATLSPEESIDANPNLMAVEKAWLKQHMDAVIDPVRNDDLGLAYKMATREKLTRGSPEYFDYIENFMGYKKAPTNQPDDEDDDDAIVAAPVSRENRSNNGQVSRSPSQIKLTPEQREFARTMGLTDVQYAQQVAALEKDKKSNPEKYFGRG